MRPMILGMGVIGCLLAGCGAMSSSSSPENEVTVEEAWDEPSSQLFKSVGDAGGGAGYDDGLAMGEKAGRAASGPARDMDGKEGAATGSKPKKRPASPAEPEAPSDKEGGGGERTRQWFPESFLWQPLVETDGNGQAVVDVRVPDQLTSWRVLALAHSRDGRQAGTVTSFTSTMPLYVDPVVPGWLYVGDRIELPLQVVNTTDGAVSAHLSVSATGGLAGAGESDLRIGAQGSIVRRVSLTADGAGPARIRAQLIGSDAAERELSVTPAGKPIDRVRGGTLAGARTFRLAGPADADVATQELVVMVFPGPLAVLSAEVERSGTLGGSPSDAAYAFALAAELQTLGARSGAEVDGDQVKRLRNLAWQRVVRYARAPDAGVAADLLAGMRDVSGHTVAAERKPQLVRTLVAGQRSDGTWARQDAGNLQELMVQTAFAARALPEEERGSRLRAGGALERFGRDVKDAYTAAVVLSTGLVEGDRKKQLEELVVSSIVQDADGGRGIVVPSDVLNPWGYRPTQAEMLAWTSLALAEREDLDWKGDLVSRLMAGYRGEDGFGAGAADVLALEAVSKALPGVDKPVDVVLTLDGKEAARAHVDPAQPKVPAVLRVATGGGNPEIGLSVDGAVGLAFVATLHSWAPWPAESDLKGVQVNTRVSGLRAGIPGAVSLELVAPSGVMLEVEQGLPPGAAVDEDALRLVSGIEEAQVFPDRVRFRTHAFRAGEVLTVPLSVQAAFAGTFSTTPLVVTAIPTGKAASHTSGGKAALRPAKWTIAAGPDAGS